MPADLPDPASRADAVDAGPSGQAAPPVASGERPGGDVEAPGGRGATISERFPWLFRADDQSPVGGEPAATWGEPAHRDQHPDDVPPVPVAEAAQDTALRPTVPVVPASTAGGSAPPVPVLREDDEDPRRRGVGLVIALAVVLVLLLATGALILVRVSGNDRAASPATTVAGPSGTAPSGSGSSPAPSDSSASYPSASDPTPSAPSSGAAVAVRATGVQADCQAPPAGDDAGRPVRYDPDLTDDGDYSTAWRCDGAAVGVRLTLTLPARTEVTELGLVNGYAKTDPASDQDRYPEYRRILRVTWILDGGRTVGQTLRDGVERPQVIRIPAAVSEQVVLRIDATTDPGSTSRTRDATLISEISIGRTQ